MWIYYYASFGPGHQSNDYGFKYYHDSYDMEDIKEYLFNHIDSCGYSIVLDFWKVVRPPADYIESRIKSAKEDIKSLKKRIKRLESIEGFIPMQKEGFDPILKKNLSRRDDREIIKRLHKAGFMYGAEDLSDWWYGKKQLIEPERSKILRIIRRIKQSPSLVEQMEEMGEVTDDYFVVKKAVEPLHQQFKRDFIAKEKEHFQIYSDVIGLWIKEQEKFDG